jgi:signal peptidase II
VTFAIFSAPDRAIQWDDGSGASPAGVAAVPRAGQVRAVSSSASAAGEGRTGPWSAVLAEPTDPVEDGGTPDDVTLAGGIPERRPRMLLLLSIAVAVLAIDALSKVLVVANIEPGENIKLLGGAVYLTFWRNTGAAFSFAEGATVLFSLIAVAVAVVIVRQARRLYSTGWAVALGLVLGGAIGNLADRIFRAPGFLRGGVVDFISVFAPDGRVFPVFNAADSAITIGGILGVLLALRGIEFDGTRSRKETARG